MPDGQSFTDVQPIQQTFTNVAPIQPEATKAGFWAHVGQSIRSMAPEDIPSIGDALKQAGIAGLGPGYQAIQALHGAATEYSAARQRGHGVPYSAAAGASTTVGVSPERMEQAAAQGDTAGVLGEAAVPTALALTPLAKDVVAPVGTAFKGAIETAKPTIVSELNKTHSLSGRAVKYAADQLLPGPTSEELFQAAKEAKPRPITTSPNYDPAAYKAGAALRTTQPEAPLQIATPTSAAPAAAASEGRPATWTNVRVQELAGQGNRDAIQQAVLRGMKLPENARYVAGDANFSGVSSNPREVTRFAPDGTPIRQVEPGAPLQLSAAEKPTVAYRVRNQGEEGVPIGGSKSNAAHATTDLEDAHKLAPGRESVTGEPQEIVKYDLSKLKEGTDYVRVPRPGQPDWIRMLRPLKESEVQPVKPQ
jgi:hypothetical protein